MRSTNSVPYHDDEEQEEVDLRQSVLESLYDPQKDLEQYYQKKIRELEKKAHDTELAKERVDGENLLLRSSAKTESRDHEALQEKYAALDNKMVQVKSDNENLQHDNMALKSEVERLRSQLEPFRLIKTPGAASRQETDLNGNSAATIYDGLKENDEVVRDTTTSLSLRENLAHIHSVQNVELVQALTDSKDRNNEDQKTIQSLRQELVESERTNTEAQETIKSLRQAQHPTATAHTEAIPITQTICGQVYDILDGENTGFLQESDGKTHREGRARFLKYVILREKRNEIFHFEDTSRDGSIKLANGKVRRELLQQI